MELKIRPNNPATIFMILPCHAARSAGRMPVVCGHLLALGVLDTLPAVAAACARGRNELTRAAAALAATVPVPGRALCYGQTGPRKPAAFGQAGLRKHVCPLAGEITVGTTPGNAAALEARIPMPQGAAAA